MSSLSGLGAEGWEGMEMSSSTAEVMLSALAIAPGKQMAARGMSLDRSSRGIVKTWCAVKVQFISVVQVKEVNSMHLPRGSTASLHHLHITEELSGLTVEQEGWKAVTVLL